MAVQHGAQQGTSVPATAAAASAAACCIAATGLLLVSLSPPTAAAAAAVRHGHRLYVCSAALPSREQHADRRAQILQPQMLVL